MPKKKVEPEVRVYESAAKWHETSEARAHTASQPYWVPTQPRTTDAGYQMYTHDPRLRPRVKTVLIWVAKPWCVMIYPNRKSADVMHAFLAHAKTQEHAQD